MSEGQKTFELMTRGDLDRYRAAVIEECARAVDEMPYSPDDYDAMVRVAAAIRALKNKP